MFKNLRKAIARRRDMRLRKWCVRHAKDNTALTASDFYHFISSTDWVKEGQETRQRIKDEWRQHVVDLDGVVRV